MSKTKRSGKIFIDYFRNDYYGDSYRRLRGARQARGSGGPAAGVKELDALNSASQFSMQDVLKRLERTKPVAPSQRKEQRIPL
jgi:DNA primase